MRGQSIVRCSALSCVFSDTVPSAPCQKMRRMIRCSARKCHFPSNMVSYRLIVFNASMCSDKCLENCEIQILSCSCNVTPQICIHQKHSKPVATVQSSFGSQGYTTKDKKHSCSHHGARSGELFKCHLS